MTTAFTLWLESLDPKKVALESFYHEAHREMLREHEARKEALRQPQRYLHPAYSSPVIVEPKKPKRARVRKADYEFTDRQLEIARRALDK